MSYFLNYLKLFLVNVIKKRKLDCISCLILFFILLMRIQFLVSLKDFAICRKRMVLILEFSIRTIRYVGILWKVQQLSRRSDFRRKLKMLDFCVFWQMVRLIRVLSSRSRFMFVVQDLTGVFLFILQILFLLYLLMFLGLLLLFRKVFKF